MTVSTVIAGLLPIMWSTRVGAEVMKPLATPVLGGMVSSLLHVLVVTPVIFFWIRERRLGLHQESLPDSATVGWRPVIVGAATVLVVTALGLGFLQWNRTRGARAPNATASGTVVRRVQSGDLEIRLLSPTGSLHTGRNTFTFEFQRGGRPTDVGGVRATGNMP